MADLRISGGHVWVRLEGRDAVIGVTDFLEDQMGEITKLLLPDLGDSLRAGEHMGHVESEDASSPLNSPITGEVLEVNPDVVENHDLVNTDPYGSGWLVKVRLEDLNELEDLMSEEEYAELTTEV